MRLLLPLLPLILLIAAETPALAQKETDRGLGGGIGIKAGLPFGGPVTMSKGAFGVDLRFGLRAGPGFVTLTLGLMGEPEALGTYGNRPTGYYGGFTFPEVSAGYKYFFHKHLFVMGEVGGANYNFDYASPGEERRQTGTCLTIAPSIGAQFGVADLSLRVQSYAAPEGLINVLAFRLAADF